MVLEKIIHTLKAAPDGGETSRKLARLSFLEWVWSLSDDADFAAKAAAADARIAETGSATPAVVAFRACLKEASKPLPFAKRRGGARSRRLMH